MPAMPIQQCYFLPVRTRIATCWADSFEKLRFAPQRLQTPVLLRPSGTGRSQW
jgi:hypothetical protein